MEKEKKHLVMMDEEVKRKYLEGSEDILSSLIQKEQEWHSTFSCPRCGCDALTPVVDAYKPFGRGILPRKNLHCPNCKTVIQPETGITIKEGGVGEDVRRMGEMFLHIKER